MIVTNSCEHDCHVYVYSEDGKYPLLKYLRFTRDPKTLDVTTKSILESVRYDSRGLHCLVDEGVLVRDSDDNIVVSYSSRELVDFLEKRKTTPHAFNMISEDEQKNFDGWYEFTKEKLHYHPSQNVIGPSLMGMNMIMAMFRIWCEEARTRR